MKFLRFSILFFVCTFLFVLNCKTTPQLKLESKNNCNFYFYIKDEIKNELNILNNINLKFLLNKKDYSEIILLNLKNNIQTNCLNLKSGLQKLELKFNYSIHKSFEGKIKFNLEESDPFFKTVVILFYMDNEKIVYLSPQPTYEKKINLLDSILNFYFLILYPFGFYPHYESSVKININNINDKDTIEELKLCDNGKDNQKCNLIFEKLILENNNIE